MDSKFSQWIELSKINCQHNLSVIRSYLNPGAQIGALLKANAYGHGLKEMTKIFIEDEIPILLAHSLDEALQIFKITQSQRIIIIGPLTEEQIETAILHEFEFIVYTESHLDSIHKATQKTNKPTKIHVKIETGTYRQGLLYDDIESFVLKIKKTPQIITQGISSHFANIEDTRDPEYHQIQLGNFNQAVNKFQSLGIIFKEKHFACSAAVFLYPETHFDIVRPGISSYGYYSSTELEYHLKSNQQLKPVLSWKTRIAQIKSVPEGSGIGYGLTYRTTRKTRLGVLPIGYYDGYDRKLSNQGYVLVHGKRAAICGRVCMNLMMIDLTDIPQSKEGDIVTLIGTNQKESINAHDLASMIGTISYEVLARLNPLIPKIIV